MEQWLPKLDELRRQTAAVSLLVILAIAAGGIWFTFSETLENTTAYSDDFSLAPLNSASSRSNGHNPAKNLHTSEATAAAAAKCPPDQSSQTNFRAEVSQQMLKPCVGLTNFPKEGLNVHDISLKGNWTKRGYFRQLRSEFGFSGGLQIPSSNNNNNNNNKRALLVEARNGGELLPPECLASDVGIKFVVFIGDSTARGMAWSFHRHLRQFPSIKTLDDDGSRHVQMESQPGDHGEQDGSVEARGNFLKTKPHEKPPGHLHEQVCQAQGGSIAYEFVQMGRLDRPEILKLLRGYQSLGCRGLIFFAGGLHNLAYQSRFYTGSPGEIPTGREWRESIAPDLPDETGAVSDALDAYYKAGELGKDMGEALSVLLASLRKFRGFVASRAAPVPLARLGALIDDLAKHEDGVRQGRSSAPRPVAFPFDRHQQLRKMLQDLQPFKYSKDGGGGGGMLSFAWMTTPSVDSTLYELPPPGPFTRLGLPHFSSPALLKSWAMSDRMAVDELGGEAFTLVDAFGASNIYGGLRCDGIHYSTDVEVGMESKWGCHGFVIVQDLILQAMLNGVCKKKEVELQCF
mmetsp:Transcript_10544/g.17079  ORF Transcript_10544/g.17079 Transcript_10544/m.17079 type:complete len:573 (-) Transcript_10544:160-1878(-)